MLAKKISGESAVRYIYLPIRSISLSSSLPIRMDQLVSNTQMH